jgi:NAD(P)-dependent dehydrogenase (short-subunit alcohol dehydrogenase family)
MIDGKPLALVTGAAHRLGKVFAMTLARRGYVILLHYHTAEEAASSTADEIRALGYQVFLAQADLAKPDEIESLFSTVDGLPHALQVLVNSAGIMPHADVQSMPVDEWDAVLSLNLRAPFLCARQAFRRMGAGGLIVNISDVGARKAWSGYPAYTTSKAGLESLTRILARSFAPQVRVNAIAPGLVLAPDDMPPAEWQRLVDRLPMKRAVSPAELSSALDFLLDNQAVTGQTIVVDGGYSLI